MEKRVQWNLRRPSKTVFMEKTGAKRDGQTIFHATVILTLKKNLGDDDKTTTTTTSRQGAWGNH